MVKYFPIPSPSTETRQLLNSMLGSTPNAQLVLGHPYNTVDLCGMLMEATFTVLLAAMLKRTATRDLDHREDIRNTWLYLRALDRYEESYDFDVPYSQLVQLSLSKLVYRRLPGIPEENKKAVVSTLCDSLHALIYDVYYRVVIPLDLTSLMNPFANIADEHYDEEDMHLEHDMSQPIQLKTLCDDDTPDDGGIVKEMRLSGNALKHVLLGGGTQLPTVPSSDTDTTIQPLAIPDTTSANASANGPPTPNDIDTSISGEGEAYKNFSSYSDYDTKKSAYTEARTKYESATNALKDAAKKLNDARTTIVDPYNLKANEYNNISKVLACINADNICKDILSVYSFSDVIFSLRKHIDSSIKAIKKRKNGKQGEDELLWTPTNDNVNGIAFRVAQTLSFATGVQVKDAVNSRYMRIRDTLSNEAFIDVSITQVQQFFNALLELNLGGNVVKEEFQLWNRVFVHEIGKENTLSTFAPTTVIVSHRTSWWEKHCMPGLRAFRRREARVTGVDASSSFVVSTLEMWGSNDTPDLLYFNPDEMLEYCVLNEWSTYSRNVLHFIQCEDSHMYPRCSPETELTLILRCVTNRNDAAFESLSSLVRTDVELYDSTPYWVRGALFPLFRAIAREGRDSVRIIDVYVEKSFTTKCDIVSTLCSKLIGVVRKVNASFQGCSVVLRNLDFTALPSVYYSQQKEEWVSTVSLRLAEHFRVTDYHQGMMYNANTTPFEEIMQKCYEICCRVLIKKYKMKPFDPAPSADNDAPLTPEGVKRLFVLAVTANAAAYSDGKYVVWFGSAFRLHPESVYRNLTSWMHARCPVVLEHYAEWNDFTRGILTDRSGKTLLQLADLFDETSYAVPFVHARNPTPSIFVCDAAIPLCVESETQMWQPRWNQASKNADVPTCACIVCIDPANCSSNEDDSCNLERRERVCSAEVAQTYAPPGVSLESLKS
ncbi:hypothetical protein V5799_033082 [Amblyomma americanum]|uniref:Uncharacterized protein n=1 Tax=Amblyomma americanum TaxID=6943 RepID=A0AAQ4DPB7_AMBAM